MHICYLTNEYPKENFPHGGLGSFVKTIAETLVKNNIQVTIIGLNYTNIQEDTNENGVHIIRLPKSKIKGLAWYFNSKSIQKSIQKVHQLNKIDVIEGAELTFAFLPKIKNIKYCIRLHGGHHFFSEAEKRKINRWKGYQEKQSFKKADAFTAVSNYVKVHTQKYLSYQNKPVAVIFNPINIHLFSPQKASVESNNITFVGTICEKKGVRQLIQAFLFVKQNWTDAVLHLYGRDWKFPDGSSYIKMLQEMELPKIKPFDKDIVFHGNLALTEMPNIYAKALVCVFPSHMETLGLVAPEAMAMEKPVVFTNLGPGPEVIQDKVDGLLVDPHKPNAIADAVLWIFNHPNEVNEMALNARKSVLKKFNPDTIALENIDWYSKIINNASN